MRKVQDGDSIRVHYKGSLEDGTQFDSSEGRDPLEFTVGSGQLIPGFEKGVIGMETGSTKTLTIQPDDAYGQRHQEMIVTVGKGEFPESITPEVGLPLQLNGPDEQPINAVITEINDNDVVIDANPPLAGKTLIFDIELVEFV